VLERGDERELDALAELDAGVGAGEAVAQAEAGVGVRLDPDRLDERLARPGVRVGRGAVVDRQHAVLLLTLDEVQAGVRGDRVEPRADRAAALEALEPAPRAQGDLLHRVLGVVDRAEHPVAVRVQLRAVGLEQPLIGPFVAPAGRFEQISSHPLQH
jgi:hypothetical protein